MIYQQNITLSTKIRSDLCKSHSDTYFVVERTIAVTDPVNAKKNKSVVFRNNASFINCISKINGVQIGNVEDLYVVMQLA